MASSNIHVSSFAYIVVGETNFGVKHLEIAPFDPNTAYARVHFTISERYTCCVIYKFNLPIRNELAISRRRDVASLCPLDFSGAYVDQFRVGLSLSMFPFLLGVLRYYGIVYPQL